MSRPVWGALAVLWPHRVCPLLSGVCVFPVYTAQAPGCSPGAGPELRALPRPTPLRFRFSGFPQRRRRRLGWACVSCLPRRAARAARSLWSALSPGAARLIPSVAPASVSGRSTLCPFREADFWLRAIQNLRKSWVRSWEPVCRLVGAAVSGDEFAPFPSPLPLASSGGWAGPPPASSSLVFAQSFVLGTGG